MDQTEPRTEPSADKDFRPDPVVLVIGVDSRSCYRHLGPLAWTALGHLALAAKHDGAGWAAPLGVRDLAVGIGVTKDTAARAVRALAAAGLVARDRVATPEGTRRSGYRLNLPQSIRIVAPPGTPPTRPNPPPRTGNTAGAVGIKPEAQADPPAAKVPPRPSWSQPDLFASAAESADASAANNEMSR